MKLKQPSEYRVWKITTLKKPRKREANEILQTIARAVQPIMQEHKWRVELLAEFCPDDPSIQGVNIGGGLQVRLRLRMPESEIDFFTFDQILDNMLHELCHNDHGPHDNDFYNLLDQLRKEWKELVSKGIKGTWRNLGGISCQPHPASLLPSEPRRLGGNRTIMKALNPKEAATTAAERRTMRIDHWCSSAAIDAARDEKRSSDISHDLVCREQNAETSNHGCDASVHVSDSRVHVSEPISPKTSSELNNSFLVQSLHGSKLQEYLFPVKILIGVVLFELKWESYKYLFW